MYPGKSNGLPFSKLLHSRSLTPALRRSALVLAFILCFSAPSYGDCDITLRWDDDPPYFMVQEGKVVGIDADLVREAIGRLNCGLSFQKMACGYALRRLPDSGARGVCPLLRRGRSGITQYPVYTAI